MSAARRTPLPPDIHLQRQYYTDTASQYDTMHTNEGSGDVLSRTLVQSILRMLEVRSILDIGSATARGLREIALALPGAFICGIEPVEALLRQAVSARHSDGISLLRASGDALPFADASFDAVCEFATLHHVRDSAAVVREMLRVARRVVVIADSNRFGQGSRPARLFKLTLYKLGLWKAFNYFRTRGKHYQISEGDGLFYSYSVYDSYDLVGKWADRILLVPAGPCHSRSWLHPLLNAQGVILIGFRDAPES